MTTAAREPDIPGTTLFDGTMARKGYALTRCATRSTRRHRDAFVRDEAGYCAQYGLTEAQLAAVRSRNVLQLIAAAGTSITSPSWPASSISMCRTSARSRRDDQGRVQGDAARRGEMTSWPTYSEPSRRRMFLPSAAPSPGAAAGPVLQAVLRRLSAGARLAGQGQARRGRRVLQRPRTQLLPRQVADLRRRCGARVPQCRRGLGHSDAAAVPRRSRALLAPDRCAGRGRVRHHDVPGDAGRPRADAADGVPVAGGGDWPCASCRSR